MYAAATHIRIASLHLASYLCESLQRLLCHVHLIDRSYYDLPCIKFLMQVRSFQTCQGNWGFGKATADQMLSDLVKTCYAMTIMRNLSNKSIISERVCASCSSNCSSNCITNCIAIKSNLNCVWSFQSRHRSRLQFVIFILALNIYRKQLDRHTRRSSWCFVVI